MLGGPPFWSVWCIGGLLLVVWCHQGSVNFSRLVDVKPTGRDVFMLYHKKVNTTKASSRGLELTTSTPMSEIIGSSY